MEITLQEPHVVLASLDLALCSLDHLEGALLKQIDDLQTKRNEMEILSRVMHALSLAKQTKRGVTIEEEEMRRLILCAHRFDPHLFSTFISFFPEGLLTQKIEPTDGSVEGFLDAATRDLTLSEVEITPIPADAIDHLLRALGQALDLRGTDVSQITSAIQRGYGDQEQIAAIMRDINKQTAQLIATTNRHMGRG